MRLTLRTMLAYLDNVLEPNEAEQLGAKIQESDFAGELMRRIRTVGTKVRMDAPKLDGKGMGNDANTVAEYLDSALPQDRVSDMERKCLESDKHLAEVAGCHQILALVLGKPAEVPESLRERVYALGNVVEAARPAVSTKSKAAALAESSNGHAAKVVRPAGEVPEYLRSRGNTGVWQFAGALLVAFLIAGLCLRIMGPFDSSHPVLKLFGDPATVADSNTASIPSADATSPATTTPSEPTGDNRASETPPVSEPPATTPPSTDRAVGAIEAATSPTTDVKPTGEPVVPPPAPGTAADAAATPAEAAANKPLPTGPMPPAPPAPPPAPEVMDVGRYLSDEQVLAHNPMGDGVWARVPPRAVLTAGERLVALPAFRPQFALASGVQVTLAGESAVQLEAPTAARASRLRVDSGRLLVVTVGAAGAQLELEFGDLRGVATLVDADSAMAVSVKPFLPPGTDPDELPPMLVVEIFNTYGRVEWQEEGKEPVEIPTNQVRIYAGGDPPDNYGPFSLPEWIDARSIVPIDRESQAVLEPLLVADKALNLTLAEALEHRQVNVRSLAARCLAYLDEFEPLVKELSDPRQYSFWAGEFQTLRQCAQRGPDTAGRLRATIQRVRPDQPETLYRLLWGYSVDQLEGGEAAALVKLLESEQMDVRVLAIQNLMTITGAMEFYRAERKPEDSRAAIQAWKSRLAKGNVEYKTPPSAIEPYKPLDRPPPAAAPLPMPRGAVGPVEPEKP